MTAPMYPVNQPGQPFQQPAQPVGYGPQGPIYGAVQPQFAPQQQPQYAPQPQYQPQQSPQVADPNTRLQGPGIPQELQGKTVGEAIRYYGIMREDFVRRNQQPQYQAPQQQPQQGQPQYQPGQSQQPGFSSAQPRVPGQPQAPVDPMRQMIADSIREVLPDMLAPVVQPLQRQNVEQTYNSVRGRFQDWQQFEGEILASMQGATPDIINNPTAWEAAYFHAKGKAMSQPRQQPQWQPPQSLAGGPPLPPQYQPQQPQFQPQVPQYQPAQSQGGYFVEGPTPPPPAYGGPSNGADPRDELFARRFNVPVEVYRSWKAPQGQSPNLGLLPRQQNGAQPQGAPQQPLPPQFNSFGPQQPQQPQYPYYQAAQPNNGVGYGY